MIENGDKRYQPEMIELENNEVKDQSRSLSASEMQDLANQESVQFIKETETMHQQFQVEHGGEDLSAEAKSELLALDNEMKEATQDFQNSLKSESEQQMEQEAYIDKTPLEKLEYLDKEFSEKQDGTEIKAQINDLITEISDPKTGLINKLYDQPSREDFEIAHQNIKAMLSKLGQFGSKLPYAVQRTVEQDLDKLYGNLKGRERDLNNQWERHKNRIEEDEYLNNNSSEPYLSEEQNVQQEVFDNRLGQFGEDLGDLRRLVLDYPRGDSQLFDTDKILPAISNIAKLNEQSKVSMEDKIDSIRKLSEAISEFGSWGNRVRLNDEAVKNTIGLLKKLEEDALQLKYSQVFNGDQDNQDLQRAFSELHESINYKNSKMRDILRRMDDYSQGGY